jgi:hypothetical protein
MAFFEEIELFTQNFKCPHVKKKTQVKRRSEE